jgi:thiamine biosynthesis lipoprotein
MAMGAPASIKIRTPLNVDARRLIPAGTALAERIEHVASLYIDNSHISFLNQHGLIYPASPHLIEMIKTAREISEATNGAFDISVQPLWELANLLASKKFSKDRADELWAEARAKVDYRAIEIDGETVRFTKPGMKITLNGIAQGYVTEQVSTLLQERGVKNGLVNFGEYKAFGKNMNGQPWRVGIQNPINVMDTIEIIGLHDQALATSAASAGQVGDQISHIFDARIGRAIGSKPAFASASVLHPSATFADAYATAFTLMDEADIRKIVKSQKGMGAILVRQDGETVRI